MKNIAAASPVKVSADGHGVVSHAGMGMLRELADRTGLSAQVTAALADTYRGPWVYAPGEVFADLAAAVADGADCIDAVGQLCGDREHVLGAKASTTTMWRLIDERIDAAHLPGVRAARAAARAAAWAVGAAPTTGGWLHIDIDATLVIDHSDNKAGAAPTWKKTFGLHPLLAFLDRPDIAGGEALAGLLRNGNAGSNTASDHIIVLHQALASLPAAWRPNPDDPDNPEAPKVLVRCDTAGSTHKFAAACRAAGAGFSFGYPVDTRVQDAVDTLNLGDCWYPAIDTDGGIRDGAWVAEATDLVNLASWPEGTRLILRKERPPTPARSCGSPTPTACGSPRSSPTHHRVSYPVRSPVWNYGTASTPASRTVSANSKPPGCVTCPATPSGPMLPGSKSSWPPLTWSPGPASSGSPAIALWPASRSPRSATGSCTWPPVSPAAPANCGYASMPPGAGRRRSPPPGTASAPPSDNTPPHRTHQR
ncbi:hypothetical protein MTY81_36720 [Mycolicibacterium sp. TY81]|nr:hypothetical protein MTY81_36720 [Mycolicibacterium sp. TY81]